MCAKYRNGFKCQIEVEVTRLRECRMEVGWYVASIPVHETRVRTSLHSVTVKGRLVAL